MASPTTPRAITRLADAVSATTAGFTVRYRDRLEALAHPVLGFGVSYAITVSLRALGWWDADAFLIGLAYFAASWARSYALRRAFRAWETANV